MSRAQSTDRLSTRGLVVARYGDGEIVHSYASEHPIRSACGMLGMDRVWRCKRLKPAGERQFLGLWRGRASPFSVVDTRFGAPVA